MECNTGSPSQDSGWLLGTYFYELSQEAITRGEELSHSCHGVSSDKFIFGLDFGANKDHSKDVPQVIDQKMIVLAL